MRGCNARQYSDQMVCDKCGLEWDVNDPDAPACKTKQQRALTWIDRIRSKVISTSKKKTNG